MTDAPSSVDTADLMFACFKRMSRLVDSELRECGLSLSRTKLLSELSLNGPLHQSALAVTFDLAPRTVTELVDTLERDGLVERTADPADRRARLVHLTPAGETARKQAVAVRQQLLDRALGTLNDQQRTALADALRQIEVEIGKIGADNGSTVGSTGLNRAP